jgi:hypothetical protein
MLRFLALLLEDPEAGLLLSEKPEMSLLLWQEEALRTMGVEQE